MADSNISIRFEIILNNTKNQGNVIEIIKENLDYLNGRSPQIEEAEMAVRNAFKLGKRNNNLRSNTSKTEMSEYFLNGFPDLFVEKHDCAFSAISFRLPGNIHLKNILRLLFLLKIVKKPHFYQSRFGTDFNRFLLILILESDSENFTTLDKHIRENSRFKSANSVSLEKTSKEICKNPHFLEIVLEIIPEIICQNIIVYEIAKEIENRIPHKNCLMRKFAFQCRSEVGLLQDDFKYEDPIKDNTKTNAILVRKLTFVKTMITLDVVANIPIKNILISIILLWFLTTLVF